MPSGWTQACHQAGTNQQHSAGGPQQQPTASHGSMQTSAQPGRPLACDSAGLGCHSSLMSRTSTALPHAARSPSQTAPTGLQAAFGPAAGTPQHTSIGAQPSDLLHTIAQLMAALKGPAPVPGTSASSSSSSGPSTHMESAGSKAAVRHHPLHAEASAAPVVLSAPPCPRGAATWQTVSASNPQAHSPAQGGDASTAASTPGSCKMTPLSQAEGSSAARAPGTAAGNSTSCCTVATDGHPARGEEPAMSHGSPAPAGAFNVGPAATCSTVSSSHHLRTGTMPTAASTRAPDTTMVRWLAAATPRCYKCGAATGQLHAQGCSFVLAKAQAALACGSRLGPHRQAAAAATTTMTTTPAAAATPPAAASKPAATTAGGWRDRKAPTSQSRRPTGRKRTQTAAKAAIAATAAAAAAAAAFLASSQQLQPYALLPGMTGGGAQVPLMPLTSMPLSLPQMMAQKSAANQPTGQGLQLIPALLPQGPVTSPAAAGGAAAGAGPAPAPLMVPTSTAASSWQAAPQFQVQPVAAHLGSSSTFVREEEQEPGVSYQWVPVQGGWLRLRFAQQQQPPTLPMPQQQQLPPNMQQSVQQRLQLMQQQWQQARLQQELLLLQQPQQLQAPALQLQGSADSAYVAAQQVRAGHQPTAHMQSSSYTPQEPYTHPHMAAASVPLTPAYAAGVVKPAESLHGAQQAVQSDHTVATCSSSSRSQTSSEQLVAPPVYITAKSAGSCDSNVQLSRNAPAHQHTCFAPAALAEAVAAATAVLASQRPLANTMLQHGHATAAVPADSTPETASATLVMSGPAAHGAVSTAPCSTQVVLAACSSTGQLQPSQGQDNGISSDSSTGGMPLQQAPDSSSSSCSNGSGLLWCGRCGSTGHTTDTCRRLCPACSQRQSHALGCPCLVCVTCGRDGHTFEDCDGGHKVHAHLAAVHTQAQQQATAASAASAQDSVTVAALALPAAARAEEAPVGPEDHMSAAASPAAAAAGQRPIAALTGLAAPVSHSHAGPATAAKASTTAQVLAVIHAYAEKLPQAVLQGQLSAAGAILAIAGRAQGKATPAGSRPVRSPLLTNPAHNRASSSSRLQELQPAVLHGVDSRCLPCSTAAGSSNLQGAQHPQIAGEPEKQPGDSKGISTTDSARAEFDRLLRAAAASYACSTSHQLQQPSTSTCALKPTPPAQPHSAALQQLQQLMSKLSSPSLLVATEAGERQAVPEACHMSDVAAVLDHSPLPPQACPAHAWAAVNMAAAEPPEVLPHSEGHTSSTCSVPCSPPGLMRPEARMAAAGGNTASPSSRSPGNRTACVVGGRQIATGPHTDRVALAVNRTDTSEPSWYDVPVRQDCEESVPAVEARKLRQRSSVRSMCSNASDVSQPATTACGNAAATPAGIVGGR